MVKEILRVQDGELAEVNSKLYVKELELVKARSKVRDLEKELESTRQAQGRELESKPRNKTTYFKVTRNIVKEEVPFKRFKYQTNYEPRRLLSYIQLATKLSNTSEQWQDFENKIDEGALNGEDLLLERNGDSLEHDDTVESEKSNDSDECDLKSSDIDDFYDNYYEESEDSNGDDYPANPNDYNGDDDDYNGDNDKYPENANGDNNNPANSNNYNGDDNSDDYNDNSENSNNNIGSDDYDSYEISNDGINSDD